MSSIPAPNVTHRLLSERLAVIRLRLLAVGLGAAAGWGIATGIAVIVIAAWLDLALDLPGGIRAVFSIAALAVGFGAFVYLFVRSRRASSAPALARTLDAAANANGQIVSGLDLTMTPPRGSSPITSGLAQIAGRRAVDLLIQVSPAVAAPAKPLRRPLAFLSSAILFIIVIAGISPRLFHSQWLRFTDPFGDHPPYSALQFDVDPANAKVIYGNTQDIRATVSGGVVDSLNLVYSIPGNPDQIVPMFPQGEGKWRATLADVVSPGKYFITAAKARTQRYDLDVITVPVLQKVTFRVSLPAYTHRPPYEGPLPQSGLSGLPGTRIVIHATSNRPLSAGVVRLSAAAATQPYTSPAVDETVQLFPTSQGSNEVTGEFEIHRSGKFQLSVNDVNGQASKDSFSGAITLLNDEKPFVRIVEPPVTSFATPDAVIKVQAISEDDYGVSKLEIYRGLNDSRPRAVSIPVPENQPTQFPGTMPLALSDYGLSPGDVIQLFARTEDNDPAGPKGTESAVTTIHIISQQDMDNAQMTRNAMEVLQSKYAEAERIMEKLRAQADELAKEIAKDDPKGDLTPEQQKALDQLSKNLSKAGNEMDRLAAHDLPLDLDKALKDQLTAMAKSMKEAAGLAKASTRPSLGAAGALDKLNELRKKLGEQDDQFQKEATQPLDYLAKVYPLMEDQSRFIDLYNQQKDLADRLSSLETTNGKDDPQVKSRMRDLQDEQDHLRDELKTLLDDIDSHVAALPDDKRLDGLRQTASDFSKAVRNSPADAQMQDARTALEEFAGTHASMGAHDAAQTLNEFIARCQGVSDKAGVCLKFQPKLSSGLGDTIQQLMASAGMGKLGAMGLGAGGGYSAARSSLQNVGLFGAIPLMSQQSGGTPGGHADHGVATQANGGNNGQENPDANGSQARLRASGDSQAPVPPQYKKSVGDYFQRVDDELSN